ncbi:MAG: HmuY family protein [Ferruginibacter sp.]|nr:HmuY family protein [Ferruginibacter sp.]
MVKDKNYTKMKKMIQAGMIAATAIVITLSSCSKDPVNEITTVEKTDSLVVNFSNSSSFAFFNFKNGAVVANTDSATTKWDFGLRLTTFILNSGAYGTGNAGAILQNNIYSSVTAAPTTGYAYDTTTSQKAIKDGSWYDYNPITHSFAPKAGQTFIFRTADNHFVKMELLAVDYAPFVGPVPSQLIYRFRYTYQANGSVSF